MNVRYLEVTLWCVAVVAVSTAAVNASRRALPAIRETQVFVPPVSRPTAFSVDSLSDAADDVVTKDVFRLNRRPADVQFGADVSAPPPIEHIAPLPKPALVIGGIVGPPWEALLEGVPGRAQAILVRPGDVIGDLKIVTVRSDSVIIEMTDTIWRLAVKKPWQ